MRSSVIQDVRSLRNRIRNISVAVNNLSATLTPSEHIRLGEELQTVSDGAMELYYLLSETVDSLEA